MNAIKTILFPTDLGKNTRAVFELACSLTRDHGARLYVLHVVPAPPQSGVSASKLARERARHTEEDWESNKTEMERKLQRLRSPDDSVQVEYLVKEGDPETCIVQTAQELAANLVILETHGKSDEERRFLGSVAGEVVRRPPCPVLLMRFPAE
jgi:nucleotide-binding universal stress UspA family protein